MFSATMPCWNLYFVGTHKFRRIICASKQINLEKKIPQQSRLVLILSLRYDIILHHMDTREKLREHKKA